MTTPKLLLENSNQEASYSLWMDATQTRFFMIPEHQQIPSGNLFIYNLNGEQQAVSPSSLLQFEISEARAIAYLEPLVEQAVDDALVSIRPWIHASQRSLSSLDFSEPSETRIPHLILALMGVTPEEVQTQPEIAQNKLRNLLIQCNEILKGLLSEDLNQLEVAQQQLNSLQTILHNHGFDSDNAITHLPEALSNLKLAQQTTPYLQEFTNKLEQFILTIDSFITDTDRSFNEMVDALINHHNVLFKQDEDTHQSQLRQAEYCELADRAIAESTKKFKVPSFNFQDLGVAE